MKTASALRTFAIKDQQNRSNIIFVTISTHKRKPILLNESARQAIVDSFLAAENYIVGRYVVMPDHIHFFCAPNLHPPESLKKWVTYWKSQTTRRMKYVAERPLWQRDFWDRQLRSGDSYSEKWSYVRNNPVRAGLIEKAVDWPYQGELNQLAWHD